MNCGVVSVVGCLMKYAYDAFIPSAARIYSQVSAGFSLDFTDTSGVMSELQRGELFYAIASDLTGGSLIRNLSWLKDFMRMLCLTYQCVWPVCLTLIAGKSQACQC